MKISLSQPPPNPLWLFVLQEEKSMEFKGALDAIICCSSSDGPDNLLCFRYINENVDLSGYISEVSDNLF